MRRLMGVNEAKDIMPGSQQVEKGFCLSLCWEKGVIVFMYVSV